ncbi:hypothetical protein HHI36_015576 [Cryptolaemus montrouzieri]|uniref:Retinol dehydrogenase 13 n=1 Tax=Cryptolaemus montrouzieri TaxID=559131 RepID=A0ABD2N6G4_9CUCU
MQSTEQQVTVQTTLIFAVLNSLHQFLYVFLRYTQLSVGLCKEFVSMGFGSSKCLSTARLDGKVAIITGCNTGIGKVTAKDFFQRGARVIMACRNLKAADEALEEIKKQSENCENCGEIRTTELDLSSLESVRKCARNILKDERQINLLINNAGVMNCPYTKTKDGFELQFGTNHLGHFLFTLLLLPEIIRSTPARIVNLSSVAHLGGTIDFDDLNAERKIYWRVGAYSQSKLANVLFTKELDRRLRKANIQGVNTYSVHPGLVKTELGRHMNAAIPGFSTFTSLITKTPEQGAQTTIYCAVDEKCQNESGLYYAECKSKEPSRAALDEVTAKRLWEVSCKLVQLEEMYNPFEVPK